MINYTAGNIFEMEVDAIVNPVNCDGIMGKGLALEFRNHFPDNYRKYVKACKKGDIDIGILFVTFDQREYPYIVNFPTKLHWKDPSRLDYIDAALGSLVRWMKRESIKSIAIPKLGCGQGRLEWSIVRDLMEKHLKPLEDVTCVIYGDAV